MNLLAAVVALGGAMFFALGAALQQFEAARAERPRLRDLARRPRWLLSGAAIILGGGLHILALGLGPLTVVQPMGVVSLLFALPIAAALRGRRKVRGQELVGAAAVAAGLLLLIWGVPRPAGDNPADPRGPGRRPGDIGRGGAADRGGRPGLLRLSPSVSEGASQTLLSFCAAI